MGPPRFVGPGHRCNSRASRSRADRLDLDGQVTVAEVMVRLQNEEFASVARNIGVPQRYADTSGYVGWLPRKAFPETDQSPLTVGEIGHPVISLDDVYIVRKLSKSKLRSLSDKMRTKVNTELVKDWQDQLLSEGLEQSPVKMIFSSKPYEWVTDQALISAPRNQPGQR